jgi:hypothetical protein
MRSLPNENGRRERPTVDLEDPQNARKLAGKNIDTVSEPCLGQPEFSFDSITIFYSRGRSMSPE